MRKKLRLVLLQLILGGICITPVEKDFKRIDKKIITEVFKEISLQRDDYEKLINLLKGEIQLKIILSQMVFEDLITVVEEVATFFLDYLQYHHLIQHNF